MEARSFAPDLACLPDHAKQQRNRALQLWAHLAMSVPHAQAPFPDEEDLLGLLKADFENTKSNPLFWFAPRELVLIRERLTRVLGSEASRKDHILQVSCVQYEEICRVLEPELKLKPELDKDRRNLERGIERRMLALRAADGILDNLEDVLEGVLLKMAVTRFVGKSRRDLELRRAGLHRSIRQQMDRIPILVRELDDMDAHEELLGKRLRRMELLEGKRDRLERRLEQAGRLALPVQPTSVEKVPFVHASPTPSLGFPYKVQHKGYGDPVPNVSAKLTARDLIPHTLERLKKAVQLGNEKGVLRLMIPSEGAVRRKYETAWTELFQILGFTGRLIVAPTYESLRTGDAPVVMPRTMHTHTERWKSGMTAELFVIDFPHPKLLRNALKGVK